MQLRGSRALVTGATGGIGTAVAEALSARGARLALTGRDGERLRTLAGRLAATAVPADLSDDAGIVALVDESTASLGRIDLLVHCAGVGHAAALTDLPPPRIAELLALDLYAPIALTRAVLPQMLAAGHGHVALVGSIAGLVGVREESVYSAAKGGLAAFLDSLADELAGTGVGTTLVVPGAVDTEFFRRRGRDYDRAFPRPVRPVRVGRAVARAVATERARVTVPRWLELAVRLHGVAPGVYRRMSRRFG